MGLIPLIRSCFGKRSYKVGVMSVEETKAYNKLEEERKSELMKDVVVMKPLPWMMFQVGVKDHANDQPSAVEVFGHKMTGLVQKTGGMAFSIECQSKAFRLPPLKINEERQKRLEKKRERAKARRDKTNEAKKSQENSKKAVLYVQFNGTDEIVQLPSLYED